MEKERDGFRKDVETARGKIGELEGVLKTRDAGLVDLQGRLGRADEAIQSLKGDIAQRQTPGGRPPQGHRGQGLEIAELVKAREAAARDRNASGGRPPTWTSG
ncbi:MAG: hypothetical protein U1G05_01155 [Kiritimatiellia bacterium]